MTKRKKKKPKAPRPPLTEGEKEFAAANVGLVHHFARRLAPTMAVERAGGADYLAADLWPAYLRAVQRYSPARGRFSTYLYSCLFPTCVRLMRSYQVIDCPPIDKAWGRKRRSWKLRARRVRSLHRLSRRTLDVCMVDHTEVRDTGAADALAAFLLRHLHRGLRTAVELRYGFMGGDDMTLREVGMVIGVTPERVRQILLRAENILRNKLHELPPAMREMAHDAGVGDLLP